MTNISFNKYGELDGGPICTLSGSDFIDIFCKQLNRQDYESAIVNIFDYAKAKGARRIFFGGSFITAKPDPHDIDCVIVFNTETDVPNFLDTSIIGDIEFDILYASEDNPNIVDGYINLFNTYKNGLQGKVVVEVQLDDRIKEWKIQYYPDTAEAEIIKGAYCRRTILERRKARGLLFTIHGVNTKAFWNSQFAPLASEQGWIFAPFIFKSPTILLFCPFMRRKVVEQFGDYYYRMCKKYDVDSASIVAHSFGTYILAKYLLDHSYDNHLPAEVDSVVLAGSIVCEDYDWLSYFPQKIGRILNISSRNDNAVKLMPTCRWIKKYLMGERDGIFGKIGYTGIKESQHPNEYIKNKEISMLNHCNMFKDEILEGVIMPFLNSNRGVCKREWVRNNKQKP